MEHDTQVLIIEMMAEKIEDLKEELAETKQSRLNWISRYMDRSNELSKLKAETKPKRGRPAKKRGPGRPKKVK
jgi:hypothetical protein